VSAKKEVSHEFQKSLKQGQKHEAEFFELFKDKLTRSSGFIEDFVINKNGKTIELKSDKYYNSGNFFIERFSYNKVDGGPYQSLKKNIDYFIFFFPAIMQTHVFKTATLVAWLELNYDDPYLLNIKNSNHTTQGFLVKRDELKHLEIKLEDIL
jgi:hypothetical protein